MMLDIWQQLQSFMGRGGPVLWVILALLVLMWILMIRAAALPQSGFRPAAATAARPLASPQRAPQLARPGDPQPLAGAGGAGTEPSSDLHPHPGGALPMLGLLGTVTGMIGVFDASAAANRFNPESMAGGISRATIPTMAGMVVALSGVLLLSRLESQAKRALAKTRDGLREEKVMQ